MRFKKPLPTGTVLEGYRIDRLLATGGFSLVYLAHDANGACVALKEYFPSALALHAESLAPDQAQGEFRRGLKCFFEEGKALARLQHPNLVRVLNFFRANGTAYLVMHYERGCTLQARIQRSSDTLHEDWIRTTFVSLLNGLRDVHAARLLHLDIKPGNILLRENGVPLLIDFGAVGHALSNSASHLPLIYTPGFASPEHEEGASGKLGPWSDIYSVGATLFACLAACAPPPASERRGKDRMIAARHAWQGKYSSELLNTIDWCLRLDPLERPQSVLALQNVLAGRRSLAA